MPSLTYRLRVRDPGDTTDTLVVTSTRAGTNPYIVSVPDGDGQEVDLLTGAVRSGSYVVEVADPVTGSDGTGPLRLVTRLLTDTAGRQHLLSRRAYVETSTDGGATWTGVWMAGYLTNLRQVDAITYAFTVSDSRRVEQNHRAFTWGENQQVPSKSERVLFPQRGCLLGGPIIGGFGPTPDSGGIEATFALEEFAIAPNGGTRMAAYQWVASADAPPTFARTRNFSRTSQHVNRTLNPFAESTVPGVFTDPVFEPLTKASNGQWWFPTVAAIITDGVNQWEGTLRAFFAQNLESSGVNEGGLSGFFPYIYVILDDDQPGPPLAGTPVRIRIVHKVVSPASPLYFDLHPVDVVTRLYDSVNIAWDATSAALVKNALGPDLRVACRITEPQPLGRFLTESIFGPFGFAARWGTHPSIGDNTGRQQFFLTRRLPSAAPIFAITDDVVQGDDLPAVYDLDEATVCTSVRFEYRTLAKAIATAESTTPPPPDGIVEATHVIEVNSADTTTFSTREVSYRIPGMVRHKDAWQPAMADLIAGIETEIFDRYGRGAPTYELPVIGSTTIATLPLGEEILIDVSHAPNKNYRIGESTVGPRVAQLVRRDETPEGPRYKLVDVGPAAQVPTAPTFALQKETLNPRALVSFTVTNAATLNAIPAGVEVEYATGASAPSFLVSGTPFTRYAAGEIPVGNVLLPAFAFGSRVWVRMRTVQPERRPTAWTSWTSLLLDAWAAPTGLTIGTTSASAVKLSWTVGNVIDPVDVYMAEGSSPPLDWSPFKVATLPANSTQTVVRGLTPLTDYAVAVAHRDPGTGQVSAFDVDTFTTAAGTTAVAPRVQHMAALKAEEDAQYPSGIALALWAGDETLDIEIQRAPDASGSPGTYETVATVPGSTAVYFDALPSDGGIYWYRSRHIGGGFTPSAWQNDPGPYLASPWPYPAVQAPVRNIPPTLARPNRRTPSLQVNVTYDGSDAIVRWQAIGQVEIWFAGAPVSPQPTSPWTVSNPGPSITADYDFYVYADGDLLQYELAVGG